MKLFNSLIFFLMITSIFGQSKSFDLDYQRALDTFDANEALEIYESIIKSNDNSDYFWLSILKKGEILYAKGSYITASKLLKDFNFNSPSNLRTEESINLFLKSLSASGQLDSLKYYEKSLKKSTALNNNKTKKVNKIWFIQFGAFSTKENAILLKDSMLDDGLKNIRIDQVFKNGQMIFYVRSKHFNSYKKAKEESMELYNEYRFTISGF